MADRIYGALDGKGVLLLGGGQLARAVEDAFAAVGCDVTVIAEGLADRERLQAALAARPRGVEVLVSCVEGDPTPKPVSEIGDADWREALDEIVGSAYHAACAVVPEMIDAGGGRIVLVSSQLALNPPWSSNGAYAAAKGGLLGLSRHMAKEFGVHGVRSNAVIPALTDREWRAVEGTEFEVPALEAIPTARLAEPRETASVVLFLATGGSGYVNGATVHVSGGRSM